MFIAAAVIGGILMVAAGMVCFGITDSATPKKDYIDGYISKYYNKKEVDVRRYFEDQGSDFEKAGLEIFNKTGDRVDMFTFGYSDLLNKSTVKRRIKERSKVVQSQDRLLNPYDFLLLELSRLKKEFPMLLFHIRTLNDGKVARIQVENVFTGNKDLYFKTKLEVNAIKEKIANTRKDLAHIKYANKEDIV